MNQKRVAYFCMEFGLDASFPIYSGGLGILAGDVLKAAKDEGLPMVGVGIRWRQGYVNQRIDDNGFPYDSFYEQDSSMLEDTGAVVYVTVRGRQIALKVWKCEAYGNVPLYLLDAFLPENKDYLITGQLYGWFHEERLAQEIVLGVGGLRALETLGVEVDLYHFNDSHPVVAGLECIRREMVGGKSFEEAWEYARSKVVFTTHTPVVAGNECYEYDVLEYMGVYGPRSVPEGQHYLVKEQLERIGGNPFSMTVAGLHLSYLANGVSQLHGETARKMWDYVEGAAPIIAVTNGVHNGTWQDGEIRANAENPEALWRRHGENKKRLLAEVELRSGVRMKEDVLTIGFARRAAPYKRSDLIFRAPETVEPWLREGKLQLIFSGKSHPNDMDGKEIIAHLIRKTEEYPGSVVFLQDYDMEIGKLLTRGCDVWLNNPIRPMEACGTSGMKAAMNGVLNCSTLDGWWPEGYEHGKNGWQIGGGYTGADADQNDLAALLNTLSKEIFPAYEEKERWLSMMRSSIQMASETFSARRMLQEYYLRMYDR